MPDALTLQSLPLFPLGTVLYPGGLLPLRIFEVRYLDMISKCHKLGAPFGVVALTQGSEVQKPGAARAKDEPPSGDAFAKEVFNDMGTLAQIDWLTTPQPGLLAIQCTGLQRFQITRREKLKHGLWIADVMRIADDQSVPIPDDLKRVAVALAGVVKQLQERGMPTDQLPQVSPIKLDDCAWVANRWCELLPLPLEVKQRMMALDNPLVRLELVNDMLERTGIAL
jgi:uncharacterized protein